MTKVVELAIKKYPRFAERRVGFIDGYEQAVKDAVEWLEIALQAGVHPCSGGRLVMEFKQFMEGEE